MVKLVKKQTAISKLKKKFSKKEIAFLRYYAETPIKYKAMERAGLHVKESTGEVYTQEHLTMKATELLKTDFAKEYIRKIHQEIFESHCFSMEKAVNEAYENYQMLKEKNSFHEMNISFETFLKVSGLLKPNGVNVNTQIVAGENPGSIVINYLNPNSIDNSNKNV